MGSNARLVAAGVGVAFAFAEAIAGAPGAFAKALDDRSAEPEVGALTERDDVLGEIDEWGRDRGFDVILLFWIFSLLLWPLCDNLVTTFHASIFH
jgi:hypothetical protein